MTALLVGAPDRSTSAEWVTGEPVPEDASASSKLWMDDAPTTTDMLCIPDHGLVRRPPIVVADVVFDLELVIPDSPVGPLTTEITVTGSGVIKSRLWADRSVADGSRPSRDHDPMSITAQYLMMLGWLHRTVILGHLLWSGASVTGDLFDYSLIDGVICSPVVEQPEGAIADAVIERCSTPA
jgi:hypothetical protein